MNTKEFTQLLTDLGWKVENKTMPSIALPDFLTARYPRIPHGWALFLTCVSSCVNSTGTAWFLCEKDYWGESGTGYRWNEWEERYREAGLEPTGFWDAHQPIALSVKDGYAYLALTRDGQVVVGYEPEFAETEVVADDFSELPAALARLPAFQ